MTSLTHLYQPLIGIQAIMLYQTLLHEMELQRTQPHTHHTLMNYLDIPLDEIYKARLKLEGIGLLKTFKRDDEQGVTVYTYELQCPFSPEEFFKDAMLSQLLYHQLGDQKFFVLKQRYTETDSMDVGEEITASFNDIFTTFTPSLEMVKPQKVEDEPIVEVKTDLSWIEQILKQRMIPVGQVLTTEVRKVISQMMQLYDLDHFEIEKSVLWALNEENRLDIEEFKYACHDLFQSKYQTDIKLVEKQPVPMKNEESKQPTTKEDLLIQELESISPKQLLEDLSGGNQASPQDMKLIQDVMTSQGLPAPVMNVLIHYVLLQTNMKLSRAYLEKIASHWSRAKIKTAREAMEFAKKEKAKFQQGNSNRPVNSYYRKNNTKEIVPEWFKERTNPKKVKPAADPNNTTTVDLEKEKAKLQALLNQKKNRFQG